MSSRLPARLHSIQVSSGGVPKLPVTEAPIGRMGVVGDAQRDRVKHGGPDRAVCVWSLEVIAALRAEGHPVQPGAAGENLTIAGLVWADLVPGDRLQVGREVVLELVSYTTPCRHIRASFSGEQIDRISHKLHPGFSRMYARVIATGTVRAGDEVRLLRLTAAAEGG